MEGCGGGETTGECCGSSFSTITWNRATYPKMDGMLVILTLFRAATPPGP